LLPGYFTETVGVDIVQAVEEDHQRLAREGATEEQKDALFQQRLEEAQKDLLLVQDKISKGENIKTIANHNPDAVMNAAVAINQSQYAEQHAVWAPLYLKLRNALIEKPRNIKDNKTAQRYVSTFIQWLKKREKSLKNEHKIKGYVNDLKVTSEENTLFAQRENLIVKVLPDQEKNIEQEYQHILSILKRRNPDITKFYDPYYAKSTVKKLKLLPSKLFSKK
jgi:hypothetical protein